MLLSGERRLRIRTVVTPKTRKYPTQQTVPLQNGRQGRLSWLQRIRLDLTLDRLRIQSLTQINSGEGQTRRLPLSCSQTTTRQALKQEKIVMLSSKPTVHGPLQLLAPTHGAAFGRYSILSANAYSGKLQNGEICCVHRRIRRTRDISLQGSRDQKARMNLWGTCG